MKIVLGGSRHLEYVPREVAGKLDEWIRGGEEFLVGDASGSDSAFQTYLRNQDYFKVLVLSSAGAVRNNLGNWPTQLIDSGLRSKSHAIHAFKDREMTKVANSGLMIWDCKSAGTLSNIIDLVEGGKECFVWIAPDSELCLFDNSISLAKFLYAHEEVTVEARKRLQSFYKREAKRRDVSADETLF
jgi:hypothetical protein